MDRRLARTGGGNFRKWFGSGNWIFGASFVLDFLRFDISSVDCVVFFIFTLLRNAI